MVVLVAVESVSNYEVGCESQLRQPSWVVSPFSGLKEHEVAHSLVIDNLKIESNIEEKGKCGQPIVSLQSINSVERKDN